MRRLALSICVVGCGPAVPIGGDDTATTEPAASTSSSETTIGSTSGVTTTSTSSTTSTSTTSTTTVDESTTGVDESSDGGPMFISIPDGGPCLTHCVDIQCDLWSQDCPEGEKCAPWADDGGDQWNASACRPIARTPAQPGDPCMISGDAASGIDDCDISSLCWDVDPQTGFGTCVPFCGGNEANPTCEGDTSCWIANDGAIILCLPTCDPLEPACGEGVSCVANVDSFFCVPSEHVEQEYAAPCDLWIGCGTGLLCVGEGSTPDCEASCCTALCDLAAPVCPDAGAGQSCVPYFERGQAPVGLEDLGVCSIE